MNIIESAIVQKLTGLFLPFHILTNITDLKSNGRLYERRYDKGVTRVKHNKVNKLRTTINSLGINDMYHSLPYKIALRFFRELSLVRMQKQKTITHWMSLVINPEINQFMMRKTLLISIAIFGLTVTKGQVTFQKSFGGSNAFEYGYSMQNTSDGGYIIAGCTFSFGGANCHKYVVKFDASANELWSKSYNANRTEVLNDIYNMSDGGFAICGYSWKGGADTNRASIVRINSLGDTLWTKFWLGADAYGICESSDGNILAAGLTADIPSDAFLIKLDKNTGDTLWTRIWGGTQQDWFYSLLETNDGGIILAGYTSSYGAGQNDILLMKTNVYGNTLWEKTYGTSGQEVAYGHCVQQTSDLGFIVTGYSTTDSTICLLKTDADGNIQWQKKYSSGNCLGLISHAVEQTRDGGYIVGGYKSLLPPSERDIPLLLKTDAAGNIQWAKNYGGSGDDLFYAVKQTTDSGYVACGRDYSFEPNGDAYLVKTDADGHSGCNERDAVLIVAEAAYSTTNINLPLHYGMQTVNILTTVTSGYAEVPLCSYTGVTTIEMENHSFRFYPNPFSVQTTMNMDNSLHNATLTLVNYLGQTVKKINNISGQSIILLRDHLPDGLYFFRLAQGNKTLASDKLVISGD